MFHGSEQKNAQLPPDRKVLPASPAVRARLMSLLKRSLVAANSFPDNLQVQPAAGIALCSHILPTLASTLHLLVSLALETTSLVELS